MISATMEYVILGVAVVTYGAFSPLKRAFSEWRRVHPQPLPDVTPADVERIVRRDFPVEQFESVIAVLNEYGTERWQGGGPRVRLAALRLANGDADKVRISIDAAKRDYRDVLWAAEWPEQSRAGMFHFRKLRRKEQQRIVNRDWDQYQTWLRK